MRCCSSRQNVDRMTKMQRTLKDCATRHGFALPCMHLQVCNLPPVSQTFGSRKHHLGRSMRAPVSGSPSPMHLYTASKEIVFLLLITKRDNVKLYQSALTSRVCHVSSLPHLHLQVHNMPYVSCPRGFGAIGFSTGAAFGRST